ncbi:hypothetical protein ABC502_17200 [Alkalimonas sp. NCh-2]|uniref:hypothetical protein n=1 Tax=Alkalimonas sp. NCh-2 TaxID=3144846 RepID=UPI0031F698DD
MFAAPLVPLLLLVSCAQPTVHLNHRYLDAQQTSVLVTALQQQGLRVELNQHPFPARVSENTLIYSPMLRNPEATASRLQQALDDTGWHLRDNRLLVESNQWFTRDNLGLFLVPAGVQVHGGRTEVDFAHPYSAEDCDFDYRLNLQPDGRMVFESDNPAYPSFQANWRLTGYPYLQLYQEQPYLNFYYQIERSDSRDAIGKAAITRLLPLSTPVRLPACSLVHGVRY